MALFLVITLKWLTTLTIFSQILAVKLQILYHLLQKDLRILLTREGKSP
jgi:hypothetical protein